MDKKSSTRFVNQMLMLGLDDPKYHRILLAAYKKVARTSPSGLPLHHLNSLWRMGSSAGGMKILLQTFAVNWAKKGKKPIADDSLVHCHSKYLPEIKKYFPKAFPFMITEYTQKSILPNGSTLEKKAKPNIDIYNSSDDLIKALKKVGCPSGMLHVSVLKNGIEIQFGKDMSEESGAFNEMLAEADQALKEHKEAKKQYDDLSEEIFDLMEDRGDQKQSVKDVSMKIAGIQREIEKAKGVISRTIAKKEEKLTEGTLSEEEIESLTKLQTEAEEVLKKSNKTLADLEVKKIEEEGKLSELERKIEDKKKIQKSLFAYSPELEDLKWGVGMTNKDVKNLARWFRTRHIKKLKEPQLPVLYRNASDKYEKILKDGMPVTKISRIVVQCKVKESYKSGGAYTIVQEGIRSQYYPANLREIADMVDFNAY